MQFKCEVQKSFVIVGNAFCFVFFSSWLVLVLVRLLVVSFLALSLVFRVEFFSEIILDIYE